MNWSDELNLALLREVMAANAHITPWNEAMQRFSDVTGRLKNTSNVIIPSTTDGKHRFRFRLPMEKLETGGRVAALASGGGEVNGDCEGFCEDFKR